MVDPVLFTIGSLEVRWYGIILAGTFLIGAFMAAKLAEKRNIKKEHIYDFMVYLIVASIIGARIAHILGNLSFYLENPFQMLAIWKGGMTFYGGLLAAVIVGYYFCKKRNIEFYDMADIFVIPLAFGIIFGRIGNFINGELYGKITNLPWAVNVRGVEGKRHPSQLYEAFKNLIIFSTLIYLYKLKDLPRGTIFWTFVLMYSSLRFVAEFFRDWPVFWLGLTKIQLISIPLAILAGVMIYKLNKNGMQKVQD